MDQISRELWLNISMILSFKSGCDLASTESSENHSNVQFWREKLDSPLKTKWYWLCLYIGSTVFNKLIRAAISSLRFFHLLSYYLFLSPTNSKAATQTFLGLAKAELCHRRARMRTRIHTQKCDEGQWHPVAWLLGCRCCSNCYLVVLEASLLVCVRVYMYIPTSICVCMSFFVLVL